MNSSAFSIIKQIVVILVFGIFIFDIAGIFFVLKLRQMHIRREFPELIKKGVSEENLVPIIITPENACLVKWIKHDEFNFGGQMYDVVKKGLNDAGNVVYYCMNDSRERDLLRSLQDKLDTNSDNSKNSTRATRDFFKNLSNIYCNLSFLADIGFARELNTPVSEIDNFYISPFLPVFSPPPETFLSQQS